MKSQYLMAGTGILTLVLAASMWLAASLAPRTPASDLDWQRDLELALDAAEERDVLVLVDIYADWCGPCQQMARETYSDARVRAALADFVLLKIDSDEDVETAMRLGSAFLPVTVVLDAGGEARKKSTGFMDAEAMLRFLEEAASVPAS